MCGGSRPAPAPAPAPAPTPPLTADAVKQGQQGPPIIDPKTSVDTTATSMRNRVGTTSTQGDDQIRKATLGG